MSIAVIFGKAGDRNSIGGSYEGLPTAKEQLDTTKNTKCLRAQWTPHKNHICDGIQRTIHLGER